MGRGRNPSGQRRGARAQALVEFALVSPVLLMVAFATIDFGRLVYTYAAISSAARDGSRILSLQSEQQSDCLAIQRMEAVGQGFPLHMDPNSLSGDTDPNNPGAPLAPSKPPAGYGYIYIWPAVATTAPQDSGTNCNGNQRGGSQTVKHVAVEIQYNFQPLTPFVASLTSGFVVKTIAVVQVEY